MFSAFITIFKLIVLLLPLLMTAEIMDKDFICLYENFIIQSNSIILR
jgi:hypothetical protein